MIETLLSVVLGSILALMTSFYMEKNKARQQKKEQKENLKTILKLESKYIVSNLDKLSENYKNRTIFPIGYLNQLDKSLIRLEGVRKEMVYLPQDNKKEEILTSLNELSVFTSDALGVENYILQKPDGETDDEKRGRIDWCNKQRPMLALSIVDLKRRAQDIINICETNL